MFGKNKVVWKESGEKNKVVWKEREQRKKRARKSWKFKTSNVFKANSRDSREQREQKERKQRDQREKKRERRQSERVRRTFAHVRISDSASSAWDGSVHSTASTNFGRAPGSVDAKALFRQSSDLSEAVSL